MSTSQECLPREGLETLLENYMYRLFVVYGRKITLDKVVEILTEDVVTVSSLLVKDVYEFTCDLYDENEANGFNNQEYPNRKG